jgi:hypothetical protein
MGALGAVEVVDTPVGRAVDITVLMVVPDAPGTYKGYWQMQAPSGEFFGERVYVQVVVPEPTPMPTSKPKSPKPPSATNEPPAP